MQRLRSPFRRIAAVAATALALTAGGCIKMKERTVVHPDGSGKYLFTVGMKKEMVDLLESLANLGDESSDATARAKKLAANPLDLTPESIQEKFQGFVAFTEPVRTEKDEWVMVSMTGYFEDVNKVRSSYVDAKSGKAHVMTQYAFRKEGDGFVLENTGGMFSKMKESGEQVAPEKKPETEEEKAQAEMGKAFARTLLGGMEISTDVEMPGKVVTADGYRKVEGGTARFWFSIDEILDETKEEALKEEMKKVMAKSQRVVCGPSEIPEAEVKAFKDEMAAARTAWQKRLAECEAAKPVPDVTDKPPTDAK